MVTALIVIIIIVLVVLLVLYFLQRHYSQEYAAQSHARDVLVDKGLASRLKAVSAMQLSGESHRQFTELQKAYDDSVKDQLDDISDLLGEAPALLRGWKLPTVAQNLHDCGDLINATSAAVQSIDKGLAKIEQDAKANRAAIDRLQSTYHHMAADLEDNSFKYGPTDDQLKSRFDKIQAKFRQFTKLTREGDQDAAAELLKEVKKDTADLEQVMKRVPDLYKPLATEFQAQVRELRSGYQTLSNQHYHFKGGDLTPQIDQVANRIQRNTTALTALKLDQVAKENQAIAKAIDGLYAVMQAEIDARPQVAKRMPVIEKFIGHAQHQQDELVREIDRLGTSYTFTKGELETSRQLTEQLRSLSEQFDQDQKAIAAQTAVESEVLAHLQEDDKNLKQIEAQQGKLNDSLATMQEDEQKARHALARFSAELRTTKRRVESLNLPGLPKKYMDSFYLVSDELNKLIKAIDEPRINMDDITKQLIIVQSDLESLQERTNDIHDSAELTERLLQYSNRLVEDHPEIEQAQQKSQSLYDKYQYDAALETIATALEDAEPGSYKRLENSYYRTAKEHDQI